MPETATAEQLPLDAQTTDTKKDEQLPARQGEIQREVAPVNIREGLTEIERMPAVERATTAAAAAQKAMVEARFVVAMKRPRDMDDVRVRILRECERPGFARVAEYAKPIGTGKVRGPSIRFVEVALRLMGNVDAMTPLVYEDSTTRVFNVGVLDLETNARYAQDVTVPKSVERRKPMDDGTYISVRRNSSGALVYLIPATDDDVLVKQNALISKALRTQGLRLIPGDIVEEALGRAAQTVRDAAAKDPDTERKAVADAFARMNVMPSDLTTYLGHDLAQCSPAELVDLRQLWTSLKEGHVTWAEVLEAKSGEAEKEKKSTAESVKAKLGKQVNA